MNQNWNTTKTFKQTCGLWLHVAIRRALARGEIVTLDDPDIQKALRFLGYRPSPGA